jgi:hypothetical protein
MTPAVELKIELMLLDGCEVGAIIKATGVSRSDVTAHMRGYTGAQPLRTEQPCQPCLSTWRVQRRSGAVAYCWHAGVTWHIGIDQSLITSPMTRREYRKALNRNETK